LGQLRSNYTDRAFYNHQLGGVISDGKGLERPLQGPPANHLTPLDGRKMNLAATHIDALEIDDVIMVSGTGFGKTLHI
jgi:hypothetical protein